MYPCDAAQARPTNREIWHRIIEMAEPMCNIECMISHGEKGLDGIIAPVKVRYRALPSERRVLNRPFLYRIFLERVAIIGAKARMRDHD